MIQDIYPYDGEDEDDDLFRLDIDRRPKTVSGESGSGGTSSDRREAK